MFIEVFNKNVKIIPSIGGWNIANNVGEGTKNYGQILHDISNNLDANPYNTLKNNIQTLLSDNSIDGIDVDWEYPGRMPIESKCIKQEGTDAYACTVSDPTQLGPCGIKDDCSSFSYGSAVADSQCSSETYRIPLSTGGESTTKANDPPTYYSNFMTQLKNDMISTNKDAELSVACAGAPWGLHWYANTLAQLLKDNIITYANIMAYDYQGFWSNGQISGFLANFTNYNNLVNINFYCIKVFFKIFNSLN